MPNGNESSNCNGCFLCMLYRFNVNRKLNVFICKEWLRWSSVMDSETTLKVELLWLHSYFFLCVITYLAKYDKHSVIYSSVTAGQRWQDIRIFFWHEKNWIKSHWVTHWSCPFQWPILSLLLLRYTKISHTLDTL